MKMVLPVGAPEENLITELDPALELPDDTPIDHLRLPTRVRNALNEAGVMTVGEIREMTDRQLLSLQNLGKRSVAHLRGTLGPTTVSGQAPR